MDSPEQLKDALLADVAATGDLDSLERLRVSALGRKGRITDLLKGLGALDEAVALLEVVALHETRVFLVGVLLDEIITIRCHKPRVYPY